MPRDRLEDFGLLSERIKHLLDNEIWYEVHHPDENVFFDKYLGKISNENFQNLDRLLTELCWIYANLQSLYKLSRFGEDEEECRIENISL